MSRASRSKPFSVFHFPGNNIMKSHSHTIAILLSFSILAAALGAGVITQNASATTITVTCPAQAMDGALYSYQGVINTRTPGMTTGFAALTGSLSSPLDRTYLFFDSSAIPDGAQIDSVILHVRCPEDALSYQPHAVTIFYASLGSSLGIEDWGAGFDDGYYAAEFDAIPNSWNVIDLDPVPAQLPLQFEIKLSNEGAEGYACFYLFESGANYHPYLEVTYTLSPSQWAPAFTSSPSLAGQVSAPYSYAPSTNESSSISIVSKPDWLTWDGSTLTGTPTAAGDYSVSIKATSTAGGLGAWQTWAIHVSPVPASELWAPSWTSSPGLSGKVGTAYSYHPTCNESVTYSIMSKPSWITWSGGILSGTPTAAGDYPVSIRAVGPGTVPSFQNWTLHVDPLPPLIMEWVRDPPSSVRVNSTYSYTPETDVPSTITILSKPDWLTWNATTGKLSGQPTEGGNYTITIRAVADGYTPIYQSWNITVTTAAQYYEDLVWIIGTGAAMVFVFSLLAVAFSRRDFK